MHMHALKASTNAAYENDPAVLAQHASLNAGQALNVQKLVQLMIEDSSDDEVEHPTDKKQVVYI